jgi:HIRAN domain
MGLFANLTRKRTATPAPPIRNVTLVEDTWSFVGEGGKEVEGRGYLFTDGDGDPILNREEESGYVAGLDAIVVKVAGVSYRSDALQLPAFDPLRPLRLIPEPTNPHDPNAVGVWDETGRVQLGYVPKEFAPHVAQAMRTGLPRQAMSLWEWRKEGQRCGLRIVIAPGLVRPS